MIKFTVWQRGGIAAPYYAKWRGPDPEKPGETRQYLRNTFTLDRAKAKVRARAMVEATEEHRFDALAKVSHRKERPATIGEIIKRYRTNAVDISRETIERNIRSLYRIMGMNAAVPTDLIDSMWATKITAATVRQFQRASVADTRDGRALQRQRVSANSYRAQAMSILREELVGMDFSEVRAVPPLKVEAPRFLFNAQLHERIKRNSARLEVTDRNAFLALLLALGAGLRKGEIAAARWEWITPDPITVTVQPTATWKGAKNRRHRIIPITDYLHSTLERMHRTEPENPFILAGSTSERDDITFRRLGRWMRSLGSKDQKPVHTLRKMFGTLATAQEGISAAQDMLGHADIRTTRNHYVGQTAHHPIETMI